MSNLVVMAFDNEYGTSLSAENEAQLKAAFAAE
jgi:uncharacterized membrane protein